ncbi:lytic transglycosylase [Cellulomonas bogoriensis 69B4 = DSM 16987]|uniref:Lytic transglycosylase n=1 Tax=Cellulomonas bogoriensis 69B4 = DSM 16987 TaxID=1386082 RepID=A0A0A0BZ36_9CELL|nr:lytic transglycosylase domain-containing protein [Cellulomonas bogoriensis]KGM13171.1 lytic transglycosylase [Cellulomonas bogoriensis 69B4 = DSM 16987]
MSHAAPSVDITTARRRRAAGGTGMGLALAVASVTGSASAAQAQDYTVRPGDTVSHIAQRTSTSVAQIVRTNNLDSRATIRVGQTLTIPAPAASTSSATGAPGSTSTHTVTHGDTVSALANRYGTTTRAIVEANNLNSAALIRVGQRLTIPATGATPARSSAPATPATTTNAHTVTHGDTVSALANRYGTTTRAIVEANNLNSAALIRVGQRLTIPATGATPARSSAPATPATTTNAHTVTHGDTVSALANRYGTTTRAIVEANNLNSAALIRVGQRLTIPATGATGAPAPAPTASSGSTSDQLVGNTFAGRTYPAATVASANENKATLLATGVPSRAEMQGLVASTARSMGVDPALAQAVAFQESGFNHASVSPANAIGTMQVIPSSGQWASDLVGRQLNLLDPQDNVVAGVAILRQLVRTSPDLSTAIASYYQGQAGVRRHGMYPDTRRYVANVQTLMARY